MHVGRYEVDSLLAEGGTARVFRAHDADGVPAALKVLRKELLDSPETLARFQVEIDVLGRFEHPNLLPLYDSGMLDDVVPWMAVALAERGSLADLQLRGHGPGVREVLKIGLEVLDALGHLHEHGIVHRDVKPENILVDGQGVAMLCDLGIARVPARRTTMVGDRMGTPTFMPPEQVDDPSTVTAASDLFALGATLFVAITGKSAMPLLVEHLREDALGHLPEGLVSVIRRATALHVEERYTSALDLSLDLADALDAAPSDDCELG